MKNLLEKLVTRITPLLTQDAWIRLRHQLSNAIQNYHDGYEYELHVSNHGRRWVEKLYNEQSVIERCSQHRCGDGTIDIYTTNPELHLIHTGDTLYFPTLADAAAWRDHMNLRESIPRWESDWADSRGHQFVPPTVSQNEIAHLKKRIAEEAQVITYPVILHRTR